VISNDYEEENEHVDPSLDEPKTSYQQQRKQRLQVRL
jgi:hypothetical protein